MAKNSIRDYANTAASNTDVQNINIDEGCPPSNINNAIREVMADLADVNDGTISLVSPDFDAATINSVAIDAFPSGTKMLFQQTTAPTGWQKDTTHNDKALRITSGTVGTGGSVAFETAFASQTPTGTASGTTGSASEDAFSSHSHSFKYSTSTQRLKSGTAYDGDANYTFVTGITTSTGANTVNTTSESSGSATHTHSFSGSVSMNAINLDVQYVDIIIATKD